MKDRDNTIQNTQVGKGLTAKCLKIIQAKVEVILHSLVLLAREPQALRTFVNLKDEKKISYFNFGTTKTHTYMQK